MSTAEGSRRYAYRSIATGEDVTMDYASKGPATMAIRYKVKWGATWPTYPSDEEVKEIVKADYELITYELREVKA